MYVTHQNVVTTLCSYIREMGAHVTKARTNSAVHRLTKHRNIALARW